MTILSIHQLELLIFLKSSIIPKWVLEDLGIGYGFGYGYGFGNYGSKIEIRFGFGSGYKGYGLGHKVGIGFGTDK